MYSFFGFPTGSQPPPPSSLLFLFFLIFQKAFLGWRCSPCLEHQPPRGTLATRVSHRLHLAGKWFRATPSKTFCRLSAPRFRLRAHAHAHWSHAHSGRARTQRVWIKPSDLHLGTWRLLRWGGGRGGVKVDVGGGRRGWGGSHLKKPLRIKAGRVGRTGAAARQQHGSSDCGWNSNVSACVAVSSLVFHPLSSRDSTWDANKADNVVCCCSWNYLALKKKQKWISRHGSYMFLEIHFFSLLCSFVLKSFF